MSNFNPNAPDTLGVEMRPTIEASVVLQSPVRAATTAFTSTATETINQVAVYLPTVNDFAFWELEVYGIASLPDVITTVTACMPAADVRAYNAYAQFDDGTGAHAPDLTTGSPNGIWQAIDSYPDPLFRGQGSFFNSGFPIDNDELIYPQYGQQLDYACRFASVFGVATNKHIVGITLKAYCQEYVDIAFVAGMSVTPYLLIEGVPYYGTKVPVVETAGGFLVEGFWPINPATGCSWVNDDLEQFDALFTSSTSGAGWLVDATGSSNNLATILQAWLEIEVTNDAVDVREAKGCLRPTVPGWWTFDIGNPADGSPGWPKSDTLNYAMTLRRRHELGKIGLRYLADDISASQLHAIESTFTIEKQLLQALGDDVARVYAFILIDDNGDPSVDSQPYASIDGDQQLDLGIDDDWPPVHTSRDLEQEITVAGGDYTWVRAMVRLADAPPTEPLTITLVNAGDVTQGTPLVIQPDDLVRPRNAYQMVEGSIGPATLAAGQFRLVFSSPTDADHPWRVQTLSAFLESGISRVPTGVGAVTWGGDTDAAVFDGVRHEEIDLVCTIATQPDPPENFTAVETAGDHECDEFVTLSWTATDVAADANFFRQYEIDYSSDGGVTWERIAEIDDEDVEEIEHHEAKRNTEATYRMRVRRFDYSCSDWTDVVTATPTMACCGYLLTTNIRPDLTFWVDDIGPDRVDEPLQDVTIRRYYGRDHSVGHHSLEWAGKRFTRRLLLAAEGVVEGNATPDAAVSPPDDVYGPLIAFLPSQGAALPYICLLDQNGGRWFVSMELGDWTHEAVGNMYIADVTFTTVTDVPSPFDAEA